MNYILHDSNTGPGNLLKHDFYYHKTPEMSSLDDYDMVSLQKEMDKATLQKKKHAQRRGVLGYSVTAMTILDRWQNNNNNGFAEEPAFLRLKFQELDARIRASLGNAGYTAYQTALDQDKAYVEDPDFKIGFLRAERYDAQRAAERILRHLQEKLDLFGSKKLTRDIRWEDLGDDSRRYLEKGGVQLLPERDEAGRLVIFFRTVKDANVSLLSVVSQHLLSSLLEFCFYRLLNCLSFASSGVFFFFVFGNTAEKGLFLFPSDTWRTRQRVGKGQGLRHCFLAGPRPGPPER